jgi:ABC-2 type transport system ATP-binding protein
VAQPAAISIDGLVKRYNGTVAVAGLDLEVERGETFALLGPNGAGKTTSVECCEGYRRPDEGSVRVLGLDPRADGDRLRPRIGLMLQEGGIYPAARPAEVLRLFASFHRDPLDPDDLLEAAGLAHVRRTRYRDLSGGQKQRLKLAVALTGRPELVFLDEPTSGLDPVNAERARALIRSEQARGRTVFLTTHDMGTATAVCDRVAFVVEGRIALCESPRALRLAYGRRELRVEYRTDAGVARATFPLDAASPELQRLLDSGRVETIHTTEASLDEVFAQVTGQVL